MSVWDGVMEWIQESFLDGSVDSYPKESKLAVIESTLAGLLHTLCPFSLSSTFGKISKEVSGERIAGGLQISSCQLEGCVWLEK